jgi:hypothetical protein
MDTYLLLSLNRIRDGWVRQLTFWHDTKAMPAEVLNNGYKGFDSAIGIKEHNGDLKHKNEDQVWTKDNHQQWNIEHVPSAFGLAPTKSAFQG